MKEILSDIFLLGIGVALLSVFIYMGVTGRYVAIESINIIYFGELALFTFYICWSTYSIIKKGWGR